MQKTIIIINLIILFSCSSINNIQKPSIENKCDNCGTIIFLFNKDLIEEKSPIPTHWYIFSFLNVLIKINDNIEFEKRIRDNESYIKNVPEGKIKISYKLLTESYKGLFSYTGFKDDSLCHHGYFYNVKEKELNLDLKSNQIVYLRIVKKGQIHQKCGLISFGWVGSMEGKRQFQEVVFEVEKVEDIKPEGLNNNKLK